ncbi:MAG: hypothetical protein WBK20_07590 [Spirochaetota bacterium]
MNLNHPEATQQALSILRSGDPFQWYVITLLAVVVYIYFNEIQNKNWKGIAAGLSLYMVHWFVEIINICPTLQSISPNSVPIFTGQ